MADVTTSTSADEFSDILEQLDELEDALRDRMQRIPGGADEPAWRALDHQLLAVRSAATCLRA